jgi:site-specific recombinase XerD
MTTETETKRRAAVRAEPDAIRGRLTAWRRALTSERKSPATVKSYLTAGLQLARFLEERGMPTAVSRITREHVESYLIERRSPSTANIRYRSLVAFFKFLVADGEIVTSPMANMRPPKITEPEVPVLSDDQLRALLATCSGTSFDDRRDTAIIRLFFDTGLRLSELANLKLERVVDGEEVDGDVDFDNDVCYVLGKGSRPRSAPFGAKTGRVLDKYVGVRSKHRHAALAGLWLGQRGTLTAPAVAAMIGRRGEQAGIPGLHPHQFRHTFSHRWMAAGGAENDLMALNGWRSRTMLSRYGASAASERGIAAHRRLSLGDRV